MLNSLTPGPRSFLQFLELFLSQKVLVVGERESNYFLTTASPPVRTIPVRSRSLTK